MGNIMQCGYYPMRSMGGYDEMRIFCNADEPFCPQVSTCKGAFNATHSLNQHFRSGYEGLHPPGMQSPEQAFNATQIPVNDRVHLMQRRALVRMGALKCSSKRWCIQCDATNSLGASCVLFLETTRPQRAPNEVPIRHSIRREAHRRRCHPPLRRLR